jgi:tetratricopeptide (TPR) repeat protein
MSPNRFQLDEQEAEFLEKKGRIGQALEIWQQLAKSKNLAGLHCQVGRLLGDLTKWKEAETAYRKALELSPKLDLPALGLAVSLLHQSEHQKALVELEVFAGKSDNALIYFFRGDALEHLGRYEEAIKAFREATSLDPRYEESFYRLGLLLGATDVAAARAALERAIEIDNQYADAYRELGWLSSSEAGSTSRAEYYLRRAVELNQEDSWALVYLGNLLWRKSDLSSAEQTFLRANRLFPQEWQTHWALATFYDAQSRNDEAKEHYMNALALAPKEAVALTDFGLSLLKGGDRRRALNFLSKALAIDPEYEKTRLLLLDAMGTNQSDHIQ